MRAELGDCLKLIRFTEMNRDEFRKRVDRLKSLLSADELRHINVHYYNNEIAKTARCSEKLKVNFEFGDVFENENTASSVNEFELSHTMLLEGISIKFLTNPIQRDFELSISKKCHTNTIFYIHRTFFKKEDGRITFPEPVRLDSGTKYTIDTTIIGHNWEEKLCGREDSYKFTRQKYLDYEIIPTKTSDTLIKVFHFRALP